MEVALEVVLADLVEVPRKIRRKIRQLTLKL